MKKAMCVLVLKNSRRDGEDTFIRSYIESEFSMEELEMVKQKPMRPDMERLPSIEELYNAVGKLRNGTAAGKLGICIYFQKWSSQVEFLSRLLELIHDVWREGSVSSDGCDAVSIPIPKKDDLTSCDNWHGICLLDVVGKVVARRDYRSWQRMSYQNRNVGLGKGEDVWT